MQLVATTPLALILVAAILWAGPRAGVILLFLTLPFDSAAAVNLAGIGSIILTDAAVFALVAAVLSHGRREADLLRLFAPGQFGGALILLMVIVLVGAVFLPRVLAGATDIFAFLRRGDGGVITLTPLRPTGSNISQSFRMAISVLTFLLMLQVFRHGAPARIALQAMVLASAAHLGLSLVDMLTPLIGGAPLSHLRTAMVAVLDHQVLLGVRRIIGGFPEPSAYGAYTIGLFGFWLRLWFGARGTALTGAMVVIMALLLIRSTSTAAYVNLIAFSALFAVWQLRAAAMIRRAMLVYAMLTLMVPALIGIAVVVYASLPEVSALLDKILFTKLDSQSGVERMGWNRQALVNLADTYGLGSGIGSVRASGWLFACLGNLGVLGTAVYLWFVARILLVRRPAGTDRTVTSEVMAACQTACAAVVVQASVLIPYPNLGTAFFAMAGIVAGLSIQLRRAAVVARPMRRIRPVGEPVFQG